MSNVTSSKAAQLRDLLLLVAILLRSFSRRPTALKLRAHPMSNNSSMLRQS
jgi:hypothetical protein